MECDLPPSALALVYPDGHTGAAISLCRSQCSHDHSTPNQGVSDHLQPPQFRTNVRPSPRKHRSSRRKTRTDSSCTCQRRRSGALKVSHYSSASACCRRRRSRREGAGACGVVSRGTQQRQVQVQTLRRKTLWRG